MCPPVLPSVLSSKEKKIEHRRLGSTGPQVSVIDLGCIGMSEFYGPVDRDESIATVCVALDAGINLLDTGDFYGSGHNELVLRDACRGRARGSFIHSAKFGAMRDPAGQFIDFDARPGATENALAHTLKRLDTDHIDIYRPARLDPNVPVEDTTGAIAEMVKVVDFLAFSPRLQPGNVETNLTPVEALRKVAAAKDVGVAQIAIAWVAT